MPRHPQEASGDQEARAGRVGSRVPTVPLTHLDGLLHVPIAQGHQGHGERLPHRVQRVLDHLQDSEEAGVSWGPEVAVLWDRANTMGQGEARWRDPQPRFWGWT